MLDYIKKFDDGGVINVDAMRKDVKNDPRFFDKKQGAFTRSGKERLAAIEEISSVQDKGLKYKINDDNTFDIVNKEGKSVNTVEGKGIETGRKTTPLYGLINKERRSKKEVSNLLGEMERPTQSSTPTSAEAVVSKKADVPEQRPEKLGSSLLEKASNVIQNIKSKINKPEVKTEPTTKASEVKSEKSAREESLANKMTGQLPTEESKPTEKDYLNPKKEVQEQPELDKAIDDVLVNYSTSSNPVIQREGEGFKARTEYLSNLLNAEFLESESAKEQSQVMDETLSPKEKLVATQQGQLKNNPEDFASSKTTESLNDYKKYRKTIFDEKIKDLAAVIKSIEENVSFQPEVKDKYRKKAVSAKLNLENLKNDFELKGENELKKELMVQFGQRLSLHKAGGQIPKYESGNGLESRVKAGTSTSRNFLSDEEKKEKQLEEEDALKEEQEQNRSAQLGALRDEQITRFTAEKNRAAGRNPDGSVTTTGPMQITNKRNSGKMTQNPPDTKDPVDKKESNSLGFLNSYKPSGLGIALGGTLAKWLISRKALKDPVANIKAQEDIFRPGYVHNVRNVRGMDATSMQALKNSALNKRSAYRGSDPIMATLFKQGISNEIAGNIDKINLENARIIRESEEGARQDMALQLQGQNLNIQGQTAMMNKNSLAKRDADIENAKALADRKTAIAKADISAITEGTGTLTGWLGNRRAVDDQAKSDLSAKIITANQNKLAMNIESAKQRMATSKWEFDNGTPEEKAVAKAAYIAADADLKKAYTASANDDPASQIVNTKSRIDNPIFNWIKGR